MSTDRPGLLQRAHRVRHTNAFIYTTMLLSACISLLASFVLSIDALTLAGNPAAPLSCNINAVLSCGAVAQSWQAQVFGFPNAFLGLIAEPVVITIAVASLGGVRFPRWFMVSAQSVYTLGLGFAYFLFVQSYFVIHALCPWCLLVTLSTTGVFFTLTHVNIRDGHLPLPARWRGPLLASIDADVDILALATWFVALFALILARYGQTLLG